MTPATMIAIAVEGGSGPAEALRPVETRVPSPGPGEVLIKVYAAGVNRPDIAQRAGFYPPPPGANETLGLEIAGKVVIGAGEWHAGDRVCALLGGGGYAEYAVCDARHVLPIPGSLTFVEAAGLPETVFTVFANVMEHGGLKSGETIMIHGATSGIGVTAIQVAKAAGARIIATGRGGAKTAAALALGADVAVDSSHDDFVAVATAEGGVDVILDMVGGPYFARNLNALRHGGRLVNIAFQAGHLVEFSLVPVMLKQLVVTGSTLRSRSGDEKARLAAAIRERIWPSVASGAIRPLVDCTFPLIRADEAHRRLEGGGHVGKVILISELAA